MTKNTKTKPKTVGQRVRAERERQGLTLIQLAVKADVDEKTLRDVENDRRETARQTLPKIARALGVSVDVLRGGGK